DSTDVQLYLSKDATITPTMMPDPSTDQPLGFLPVNYLNPGQCQTLTRSLNAWVPSEGAWYVGAVADPSNFRPELIDDNNTLAGTRMGVGHNPDFVVTSVKGPTSVTPGQQFNVTVTVCNQGTRGDSTDVELYLSSDDIITPTYMPDPSTDQPLGFLPVNHLDAGQCQTLTQSVSAWAPSEGAWYLGAAIDPGGYRPELIEDNNTLAGTRIGVGHNPDFVVTSVTGPASTMPGQQFNATVTVCNQGTLGGSTEVELYLSSDAIITPTMMPDPTSDQPLGFLPVNHLNAGQCQTLTQSVSAWVPSEGAWYLGAATDPGNYRPELIEDNNTLAGTRMGVGHRPDFIVTAVKGPASVTPGQQFNAMVTVCNQGSMGDSTEVELYLSSDATITPTYMPDPSTDQPVGFFHVNYLNPGQCQTLTQSVSAWVPSEGAWYLGAAADPVNGRPELIEDNNTLAGTRMGIGNKPDFVVTSVTGPASVKPDRQFTATVTVCNQGTQADSTEVELYLSKDATITPMMWTSPNPNADLPLLRSPTHHLNPGQCQTLTQSVSASVPSEGAWYVGAAVDPENYRPELIEDNNTLAGTRMGVGYLSDIVVTSVTGPASVKPGQSFDATVTVCNQGTMGDSTDVQLYLSKDATITPTMMPDPSTDQPLDFLVINYLGAGQCQTLTKSVSAWVPSEGAWYVGAVADPGNFRPELIEDNNTLAGTRMGVGQKSDIVVTSVKGPTSVLPGQQFNATVTVCNQGTLADATDVELYLSKDDIITPTYMPDPSTDQPLGFLPVGHLNPGQCQTLAMPVSTWVPSEGAWYLGAVADPGNFRPELIEDNNTLAGTRMGIGNRPDFIVTSVVGPSSVRLGQPFNATVTVCNQGTQREFTDVHVYLSSDATITPTMTPDPTSDQPVGFFHVEDLDPGQCQTVTQSVNAWVPSSGAWYLGAATNPSGYHPELIEDNNTRAGTILSVTP
ncbi:MAG TPA: CARDB domain-containing protein, partial [Archangium sp.]|uniref:CARDB domain-containing protein n=1 Tax=Archangium sp. TaxID=1872627 RepID=UPI002EDA6BC0